MTLVGRNEGGRTLSRAAVSAMMANLKIHVEFEGYRNERPVSMVVPIVQQVMTMAISDANKMLMLECEGAVETLVTGLLLRSPRRSEAGADAVQEACVELLLSLALCGAWAEALRGHAGAMSALRDVKEGSVGTEASRRSAESCLFELEGWKEADAAGAASPRSLQFGGLGAWAVRSST